MRENQPRKQQRWLSREEIIAAIDRATETVTALTQQAVFKTKLADSYVRRANLCEPSQVGLWLNRAHLLREEADKLTKSIGRIERTTLPALKAAMGAADTLTMPFVDKGVVKQ